MHPYEDLAPANQPRLGEVLSPLDIDGWVDPNTPAGQRVIEERRQSLDETRGFCAKSAMAAAGIEADDVNPA